MVDSNSVLGDASLTAGSRRNSKVSPAMQTYDMPVVLFIPPQSSSLDMRPHLERLNSSATILEWWCGRVRQLSDRDLYIIVHTNREQQEFSSLVGNNATVVFSPHSTVTHSLAAFSIEKDLAHIALLTLASALVPMDYLDELAKLHIDGDYSISWCVGLPNGVSPCFLAASFLRYLARLDFPWLASHPVKSYRRLDAAITSHLVSEPSLKIRQRTFDFGEHYSCNLSDMPMEINFYEGADIDIAREVFADNEELGGIDALQSWKRILIDKKKAVLTSGPSEKRRSFHSAGSRVPRVLYVSNASAFSGAEESLCQLLQKINRKRYEVFAAVGLPGLLQRRLQQDGIPTTTFRSGFANATIENFRAAQDLISRIEPDIVHSNGIDGLPILWETIARKIPFVQHIRNGDMTGFAEYVESAGAVVAVSNYLRDSVLRFSVSKERVHVIYDEVDAEWFSPQAVDRVSARARYGLPVDGSVIVMIARFAPNKRHDLMLEAFGLVGKHLPRSFLFLKGENYNTDPYYDRIRTRIESHNCKNRIIHSKFVDDIRDIHALADVLVLCSDQEGLGRCVVEAMSMGVPVVVTDTGGTHEIVENGRSGIVVKGGDAKALADGILRVLDDREFRERASIAARQIVQTKLTSTASADAIMTIYGNLLKE